MPKSSPCALDPVGQGAAARHSGWPVPCSSLSARSNGLGASPRSGDSPAVAGQLAAAPRRGSVTDQQREHGPMVSAEAERSGARSSTGHPGCVLAPPTSCRTRRSTTHQKPARSLVENGFRPKKSGMVERGLKPCRGDPRPPGSPGHGRGCSPMIGLPLKGGNVIDLFGRPSPGSRRRGRGRDSCRNRRAPSAALDGLFFLPRGGCSDPA